MFRHPKLILRNVFSIFIQITQIRQILFQNNLRRKIQRWVYGLADAAAHRQIAVITDMPINTLLDFTVRRKFLLFKTIVNFNKQFMQHRDILQAPLIFIYDNAPQFRIKETQNPSMNLPQPSHCICRISVAVPIVFRKDVLIKLPVPFLPLLQTTLPPNICLMKHKKKRGRLCEIIAKRLRYRMLLQYRRNTLYRQIISFLYDTVLSRHLCSSPNIRYSHSSHSSQSASRHTPTAPSSLPAYAYSAP